MFTPQRVPTAMTGNPTRVFQVLPPPPAALQGVHQEEAGTQALGAAVGEAPGCPGHGIQCPCAHLSWCPHSLRTSSTTHTALTPQPMMPPAPGPEPTPRAARGPEAPLIPSARAQALASPAASPGAPGPPCTWNLTCNLVFKKDHTVEAEKLHTGQRLFGQGPADPQQARGCWAGPQVHASSQFSRVSIS